MPTTLTNADLHRAARELGCEVALIRAIDKVESSGSGFTKTGELKLRFEAHWFKHYTAKSILGSDATAFRNAEAINSKAALLSTSWGRYQMMGFNFALCGYASVEAMVAAFKKGEPAQLTAFVQFIKKNNGGKLWAAVKALDFQKIAYYYNGAGYAVGKYDTKIQAAYNEYRSESFPDTDDDIVKKKTTGPTCSSCSSALQPTCTKAANCPASAKPSNAGAVNSPPPTG